MNLVRVLCSFLLFTGFLCAAQVQSNQQTASQDSAEAAHKVPVIDGGAGPCSLELVVTEDSKPVYVAAVKVHVAYGFGGVRKLDLEASTNIDGKVKFVGLPSRVRRPPLEFQASKDQLLGTATYDPYSECQAKHDIALEKANPQQSQ
jgi:hypothetical protein